MLWRNNRFRLSAAIVREYALFAARGLSLSDGEHHIINADDGLAGNFWCSELVLGALYGPQMNCSPPSARAARDFACFCFGWYNQRESEIEIASHTRSLIVESQKRVACDPGYWVSSHTPHRECSSELAGGRAAWAHRLHENTFTASLMREIAKRARFAFKSRILSAATWRLDEWNYKHAPFRRGRVKIPLGCSCELFSFWLRQVRQKLSWPKRSGSWINWPKMRPIWLTTNLTHFYFCNVCSAAPGAQSSLLC